MRRRSTLASAIWEPVLCRNQWNQAWSGCDADAACRDDPESVEQALLAGEEAISTRLKDYRGDSRVESAILRVRYAITSGCIRTTRQVWQNLPNLINCFAWVP